MDQAAAQPARASSAAPAHPTAARAPAAAVSSAPAHTATVAHTAQPAGFWEETMKPAVFWTALSATATLFAVGVALATPFILDFVQQRRRRLHANAVAQAMFKDAVAAAEIADVAIQETRRLKTAYREADRQLQATRAGKQEFVVVPQGIAYSTVLHEYTFADDAIARLRNVANVSFENIKQGRPYLPDFKLGWAALLYEKFADAQAHVANIQRIVSTWTQPAQLKPSDLDDFESSLHGLLTSMRMAGFALGDAAGEPVPAHWHPGGAEPSEN